jgi:regulator of replication initiation timing
MQAPTARRQLDYSDMVAEASNTSRMGRFALRAARSAAAATAASAAMDGAAGNAAPPMTYEERAAVEAYINYRLKLASHPLAATGVGSQVMPYTTAVRDISDSVLRCELRLIETRLEAMEDDLREVIEEHEAARIAVARLREATGIQRLKVHATSAFHAKAKEVIFEASKRADGGRETDNGVLHTSADITLRRARLHDALSAATDVCPTVIYPTIMEYLSTLAQTRRRVEYEKKWSDDVRVQLERIHREMAALRMQEDERRADIEHAKAELEEAHREVFSKRKKYIITHKRLMGAERLPNGAILSPDEAEVPLAAIRSELAAGRTDTLDRLANTDCAELMGQSYLAAQYLTRSRSGGAGTQAVPSTAVGGYAASNNRSAVAASGAYRDPTRDGRVTPAAGPPTPQNMADDGRYAALPLPGAGVDHLGGVPSSRVASRPPSAPPSTLLRTPTHDTTWR